MNRVVLEAMRDEIHKIAAERYTLGYSPDSPERQEFEQMTPAKWKQTAKDLPVSILGGATGYLIGRMGTEYLIPRVFNTPPAQQAFYQHLPTAMGLISGAGSMFMAQQRRNLKGRREAAQRKAENDEVEAMLKNTRMVPSVDKDSAR